MGGADVFAVERVHGDAEVAAAAGDIEDLGVADVEQRVAAVRLAQRDLIGERRCPAHGEVIVDAALVAHREGRTALEVNGAAERVRAFVGQVALDEFEALEHRAGEIVDTALSRHRALGGEHPAVERDVVQRRAHATDGETVDAVFEIECGADAGEENRELARAHVREVAVGIHRDDVLRIGRVALRGDRRRAALALAGYLEGLKLVDRGGEVEIARGVCLTRGNGDGGARGIESRVGDNDFVRADGQCGENVAPSVVGERGEAERGNRDLRALEEIAGGEVGDGAGEGGGGVSGAEGSGHENRKQCEAEACFHGEWGEEDRSLKR